MPAAAFRAEEEEEEEEEVGQLKTYFRLGIKVTCGTKGLSWVSSETEPGLHVRSWQSSLESPQRVGGPSWTPSKDLQDSLVDMYTANPKVNVELRQRLPSQCLNSANRPEISLNTGLSNCSQASHLQEFPISCSPSLVSHRSCVSPVSPPSYRSPLSPLSSRFLRGPGEMEVDLPTSRGPSPWAESCRDASDEDAASRGPGSPAQGTQLIPPGDSPHQMAASVGLQSLDQDKNISFLLKELDTLREINNKEQLVQKEKELQRREVDEELKEEQRDAQRWERPTSVLEEVLASQRDRDQALMSRLLLANEERDAALLRARRLQQASELENISLQDPHMDVDDLLQSVCEADSVQDIQKFGSILIQHLRLTRQRQHEITAQEMKSVMDERDRSSHKCKSLEEDLLQQRELWASQEELLRLQRERDAALEDRCQLEAEIQALRANHSSQDLALPSLPCDIISSAECEEAGEEAPPSQPPPLLLQLQQLTREKQSVEAELQRCQEAEREAGERVRRLERLVEVLRKKVGTGSLRAVI
ncbi:mirror-image polydactyly gene 1 protein isoform 2-T2 [Odontesthes bonariensis]|uniref:mirror-image polydactyly gene 1 protein isoform X2 n=1 Tax=Odontesthes bonariensis TaxID=219752 RepID=UPI003F5803C2